MTMAWLGSFRLLRWCTLAYAALACALAALVSIYFLGFLIHRGAPLHLGNIQRQAPVAAYLLNAGLLVAWGVQHSCMARAGFKQWLARWMHPSLERSTYVLISSAALAGLMLGWQPLDGRLWLLASAPLQGLMGLLLAGGLVLVVYSASLTDGLDLLGWRQAWCFAQGTAYQAPPFTQRSAYRWIRHPMMLGALLALWATPDMTMTHGMFALGMSAYILIGIHFEERSMQNALGDAYRDYQKRTKRLVPAVY